MNDNNKDVYYLLYINPVIVGCYNIDQAFFQVKTDITIMLFLMGVLFKLQLYTKYNNLKKP